MDTILDGWTDGLQEPGTRDFYVWAGTWAALDDEMTGRVATTIMFVMKWTMYVCFELFVGWLCLVSVMDVSHSRNKRIIVTWYLGMVILLASYSARRL